ncbi:MAG: short-subunit dehydrogenase [Halioglobus sp.]|jgi:short-subunit dehydrogenase
MSQTFANKTVIITGASAGVGAACAHAFADEGANLVLAARGQEALDKIGKELASKTEVLTQSMNVADDTACAALLESARDRFGAIHVLVNNAGMHSRGDVSTVGAQGIAAMVDVNLRAPFVLSALATPYIEEAGGGAIVMVGSLAGRTPMQGAATYAATKAGLRSFTYSFADEVVERGIHVGLVSPGPIDTGFIMDEIDEVEDIVFSQPMSTAAEVAGAVLSVALGEETEICLPAISGRMTTLSYLFPGLRKRMRPKLYAMGRKNKDKYRER